MRKLKTKYATLVILPVALVFVALVHHASAATTYTLKWSKTIPAQIVESSPMPIHAESGTVQDVIFGARNGKVYVMRGADGTDAPGWPQQTSNPIDSTASSGDVDSDGWPEIFIGSGIADIKCSGGGLFSYRHDGGLRFNVDTPDAVVGPGDQCQDPAVHASPALADINRNGEADVTFGALGLKSWSFTQSGAKNFGWPYYWDDTQYASPALADINGDGQTDIILPGDSSPGGPVDWKGGMVRAMSGYAQQMWEFRTNEIVRSSPSIGDVRGNGDIQIVFGTGNFWAHNGGASDSTKVFELNRSGQLQCSHDVGAQVMASPALADVNGDGIRDIVFGTWQTSSFANDGKVWALDGKTCNPLSGYPFSSGGFLVIGQISTADLNNDGSQDLVVPTANGVHAFDGKTGAALFTINLGIASYQNAPLITDIDGNGQLDIIIAGTQGDGVTGIVQRYELDIADNAVLGANGWAMNRYNTQQTGSTTSVPLLDPPSGAKGQGYWMVASDGGVFPFGSAKGFGSTGNIRLNQPIVGMASSPSGQGYWLVAADGGIFPFGDAKGGLGSTGNIRLTKPIVGMQPTASGNGYWLVAADGGIFPFGDAKGGLGSTGNINLRQPIVGMAATKSGNGYWLVAADGGIFPFGDAVGYGSAGNLHLRAPIISMSVTPSGNGYWLVASDGGVFTYGDAAYYGSAGALSLSKPIVAMSSSPMGGYFFAGGDGGVFTYNAAYYGSTGGLPLFKPIVAIGMVGY